MDINIYFLCLVLVFKTGSPYSHWNLAMQTMLALRDHLPLPPKLWD